MDKDIQEIEILPIYLERLENIDLYNWIAINLGEEAVPHIGEFVTFSVPENLPDKIVYTVKDVEFIFDCKRDKAIAIMHLMIKYDCATKMGKEFYTTKEKLLEFLDINMGKKVVI